MTVIIIIVIAALLLGVGIYVYSTNSNDGIIVGDKSLDIRIDVKSDSSSEGKRPNIKKPGYYLRRPTFFKLRTYPTKLKAVIEMVIADGVLTVEGREEIKEIAISKGFDYVKVLDEVEKHVMFFEIDSHTKLVDLTEKNRVDFEKLVEHKFCRVLFTIKEWSKDKYIQGEYSEKSPSPDFLVEFIGFNKNIHFAVKCKWRQRSTKDGIVFSTPDQLNQFREYAKESKVPFFIVIGLEGKGATPERLFIVPLKKISKPFILLTQLKKYEKKVGANFYFDYVKKELK